MTTATIDDFDTLVDQAANYAREATAPAPKAKRITYTGKVREQLQANPDIGEADLIRRVLADLGLQSSGLDAMDNDELMQVVKGGARVLSLAKDIAKSNK